MDEFIIQHTQKLLEDFNANADAFLRRGAQDALPDRRLALERLKAAKPAFSIADDTFRVIFAQATHLLADLFDKYSEEDFAAEALQCFRDVEAQVGLHRSPAFDAERHWISWAESVNLHRRESAEKAIDITSALIREIEDKEGNYVSDDFRTRLYYAHGRHLQKAGRILDAENSFARSLEFGEALAGETANEGGRPRLRYAHLLTSLNLVQLARILIEQSDLRRAWRLLTVAGSLQAGIDDPINKAFVELYKGSVLRQLGRLDEAISRLDETVRTFRKRGHHRYLMRSQYELSKAYLNRAELPGAQDAASDLDQAKEWLARLTRTRTANSSRHRGDERLRDRFDVRCAILAARTTQRVGGTTALKEAEAHISRAFDVLHHQLKGSSRDLLVLATWVKGNILIELQRPLDATKICLEWVAQRNDREPVDRTDDAWVDLVLWKSYVCTDDISRAEELRRGWMAKAATLENTYVRSYAHDVMEMHRRRIEAAFFLNNVAPEDDTKYWDWKRRQRELQTFMLRRVIENHPHENKTQWAKRLGLTEPGLNPWFERTGTPAPPTAGTSAGGASRKPSPQRKRSR